MNPSQEKLLLRIQSNNPVTLGSARIGTPISEAVLRKALVIRPNDLNSRTELAKIYQRQGKLDQAEEIFVEEFQHSFFFPLVFPRRFDFGPRRRTPEVHHAR